MAWLEAGVGWPLILIHAFPLSSEMWRPQLESVPHGCRMIAPDLRGFGRTRALPSSGAAPGAPVTMDDYAADIGDLMDCLKLDDAVIGGLSMGGYVTFALYRQLPGRFTGMVLADTRSQADTADGRSGRTAMRARLAESGPSAIADQMLPTLLSEAGRERPDLVAHVRTMIETNDPMAIDAALAAMMNRPDSTPTLEQIACKTLVVVGEEDAITPVADARAMQQAIRRSRLTTIAGAGHLANLEQPGVFSQGLADFLAANL